MQVLLWNKVRSTISQLLTANGGIVTTQLTAQGVTASLGITANGGISTTTVSASSAILGFSIGNNATSLGNWQSGQGALNFPNTLAQTSSDLTLSTPGCVVGDLVLLIPPLAAISANSFYSSWVSAANTVTVRFNNYSAGAIDPASGTFTALTMTPILS